MQTIKLIIILGIAIIIAIVFTLIFKAIFRLCDIILTKREHNKYNTNNKNGKNYSIAIAIVLYMAFLLGYVISWILLFRNADDLKNYCYFLIMGLSAIVWCYFEWPDYKFFTLPKIRHDETGENHVRFKKIIIFSFVMLVTVTYNYANIMEYNDKDIRDTLALTNATIISAIIIFDRILNQLRALLKSKATIKQEQCDGKNS